MNQKILTQAMKRNPFLAMFLGLKCYINQALDDISTNPSGKTLNIAAYVARRKFFQEDLTLNHCSLPKSNQLLEAFTFVLNQTESATNFKGQSQRHNPALNLFLSLCYQLSLQAKRTTLHLLFHLQSSSSSGWILRSLLRSGLRVPSPPPPVSGFHRGVTSWFPTPTLNLLIY